LIIYNPLKFLYNRQSYKDIGRNLTKIAQNSWKISFESLSHLCIFPTFQSNGHFYVFPRFYNNLFYTFIPIRIMCFSYLFMLLISAI
jgi:hypothetical protein